MYGEWHGSRCIDVGVCLAEQQRVCEDRSEGERGPNCVTSLGFGWFGLRFPYQVQTFQSPPILCYPNTGLCVCVCVCVHVCVCFGGICVWSVEACVLARTLGNNPGSRQIIIYDKLKNLCTLQYCSQCLTSSNVSIPGSKIGQFLEIVIVALERELKANTSKHALAFALFVTASACPCVNVYYTLNDATRALLGQLVSGL